MMMQQLLWILLTVMVSGFGWPLFSSNEETEKPAVTEAPEMAPQPSPTPAPVFTPPPATTPGPSEPSEPSAPSEPLNNQPQSAEIPENSGARESELERFAAHAALGDCRGTQHTIRECKIKDCEVDCIDCVWDEWVEWSGCGCDGLQERSRVIKIANNDCGKSCEGNRVETSTCDPGCTKKTVNCELSTWSPWSNCDKHCGGGQSTRLRHLKQKATEKGISCEGKLKETMTCNPHPCDTHVNCKLGDWSNWDRCTKTCGGGQQLRIRSVQVPAVDGGVPCNDPLREIRGCNEQGCGGQIDCIWQEWETWGACSRTCGGGQKNRNRLVKVSPRKGGKLCAPLVSSETEVCNDHSCIAVSDCLLGPWSEWDACSCSCNGVSRRMRHIEKYPEQGGHGCAGSLKEVRGCNEKWEPSSGPTLDVTNCKLGSWDNWSSCSRTCGTGVTTRQRNVIAEPQNGGKTCEGTLNEVKGCNETPCSEAQFRPPPTNPPMVTTTSSTTTQVTAPRPVSEQHAAIDCKWSNWDTWSACSTSCGGGQRNRLRQIIQMCNEFGEACGHHASMEVEACNTEDCGCIDCVWETWGDWAACSCTGLQERHRAIKQHRGSCGKICAGPRVMTKECQPHCGVASQACVWGAWSSWGTCTAECGGGQEMRHRSIATQSGHGGRPCTGYTKEALACNSTPCNTPEDCKLEPWSTWGSCSRTCGGGEQYRSRSIISTSVYGGNGCHDFLKEVRGCGEKHCGGSEDCLWNNWSTYSACSATCGGGMKQRDRSIKQAPRNGGKLCDPMVKTEIAACNTQLCAGQCVDAQWGLWGHWSTCSVSCGVAYRSRSRTVSVQGNYCGKGLDGKFQDYEKCSEISCAESTKPIDCQFSDWTDWNDCSCSCDGVKDRTRRVNRYASNGGSPCAGSMKMVSHCNVGACEIKENEDCQLSEWSEWDACTVTCNGGMQAQRRTVLAPQKGGGRPCDDSLKRVRGCSMGDCMKGVDCLWGEWTTWSDCTLACNGGQKNRYRHIEKLPEFEGQPCDLHTNYETAGCNQHSCGSKAFCTWAGWDSWSPCSKTCGWGTQDRSRHLDVRTHRVTGDVLASGILDELFFDVDGPASEKLFGAFVAGVCVSGLVLSFVHRIIRSSGTYAFTLVPQRPTQ
eukprot:GEMP01001948.1.p1 GENE.GEMP01001948.1~~GEMP01001948.1.p1  ORF type:complete len:1138 (+),score=201.54 GEMP01001948.1:209-3622(+)